ncbi:araC-like ligand binding domain protein [Paraburkholderia fungorum]|jgi:quercetin dioxygenase-like cupin family protein|uniref:AraC-like ligand binding domain protein n=1 Tax=Paraburkholderia fungorum TaxID=134537 RepID=A0AAP5QCQ0_9BURK|nr:cupin domain-containing protein [Paraburkholderia fungorum]ALE56617.1 cupin [Burkholderia sp. HB1]KFX64023.1 cupin [Burkholderia sp. K24]OWJ56151.1 cupin [Burkholderia sp. Bk]AJZ57305.1 araC-like ligand binding domain protein [Paraburkholderia fungorum]MBU7436299.1 cupin domain-containing protein [Paraburkholderia fungorum]
MTSKDKTVMYNWNDLPRETVRKGVERVGFRGEDCILVMNYATPGMDVRPHQHDFEQLAICVQGRMNYHVGDEVFEMTPGSMLRVPAHTVHYAVPLGDEVVMNLDVFAPIRNDYAHLVDYQKADFSNKEES